MIACDFTPLALGIRLGTRRGADGGPHKTGLDVKYEVRSLFQSGEGIYGLECHVMSQQMFPFCFVARRKLRFEPGTTLVYIRTDTRDSLSIT